MDFLAKALNFLDRAYPFTAAGSLLTAAAVYLLGFGFGSGNLIAFILGAFALLLLTILVVDARLQAFRLHQLEPAWESAGGLYARLIDVTQTIHLGEIRPHYFYRFHFLISGELRAGREASLRFSEEAAGSREGAIDMPLYFPVSGVARVRGRLYLKDVFGLTRTRVGLEQERTLHVRPPALPGKPAFSFQNTASLESVKRARASDEEKYYMREYQPGDRLKDINWKASFKINELITRISPRSPDESKLLHVELRNFNAAERDSPEAIMHLNYAKSWLVSFLYQVKREHPDFQFRVVSADWVELIVSDSDIERLSHHLAELDFVKPRAMPQTQPVQERFVFTTAYDVQLAQNFDRGATVHLFRTTAPGADRSKVRSVRFMPVEYANAWPAPWVFRRASPPPGAVSSPRGRTFEEPLSVALF